MSLTFVEHFKMSHLEIFSRGCATGASVAASHGSRAPLLQTDVEQAPHHVCCRGRGIIYGQVQLVGDEGDNLLEASPEEIKKQQEDAERSMKKLLECL